MMRIGGIMVYISGFGTKCAALILGLAVGTTVLVSGAEAASSAATLEVNIYGLRSNKGNVLVCVTANPRFFPDCSKDPAARTAMVPAGASVRIEFGHVPAGRYAISLIHDENGNRKMDMAIMMPKEGYGFSRDAPVRMAPPKFTDAVFALGAGTSRVTIKMRYFL